MENEKTVGQMLGLEGDDQWLREQMESFQDLRDGKGDVFARITTHFLIKRCPQMVAAIEGKKELAEELVDISASFMSIGYLLCADQRDKQEKGK